MINASASYWQSPIVDICRRSIREGESNRATRQHRAVACWSWSRLVEYGSMIKNPETYRRQSEAERWEALRQMSAEESIALGEALLSSEIMRALHDAGVAKWQTRPTQNPLSARTCGFKSLLRYSRKLAIEWGLQSGGPSVR